LGRSPDFPCRLIVARSLLPLECVALTTWAVITKNGAVSQPGASRLARHTRGLYGCAMAAGVDHWVTDPELASVGGRQESRSGLPRAPVAPK
jgi:hypothetical protein